ncbi:glycosyltransferase [Leucobacter ruminantium]|uniref:D-inositol 3-phosphate glycosyltransferase n=1 Tax=Leucobacter ruminantium TaxID=1289170 RepID=A0A939RVW2_9MICO|nr:glycosyltransferase [Leucobacter ruminantium]MBO1804367.1 glycosyltransferase [Leucobacter ruminantium]
MHILVVTDQHAESLGGVQVAIRLQRRFLERLGHRVTVAAPALHRPGYTTARADREAYIDLPSHALTRDREYGISLPGARTDRALAAALARLPRVDLVHLQGDFWGAMIGLRAARGLRVPVVHTMHNHVDEGTRAVTPLAPLAFQGLRLWRSLALGRPRGAVDRSSRGAWRYLAELASEAALVTAPSAHFADELMRHGVAREVLVTPNGVDDEAIAEVRARPRTPRVRPRLVWLGRMSQEKRVLEFIDAIAESGIDADVALHGAGLLLPRVEARIAELGLADRVAVPGPVPYRDALAAMRDADALVQTSIGFETQGLTPFEAAALGTPTIFCDPEIADDVAVTPEWRVADASVSALAQTLRRAVGELSAAGREGLRVPDAAAQRFLQSTQAARLVELYERARIPNAG